MTITYKFANDQIAGRMEAGVPSDFDGATKIAQRYMAQFPSITSAIIENATHERMISRATEWQKRNG